MFTLGFDVAKDKVDVALINKAGHCRQHWQIENTTCALSEFLSEVRLKHPKLRVGCEATGIYHLRLVMACSHANLPCYVLNPILTKQFTRSTVRGRKTDLDDALSIARLVLRCEGNLVTLNERSLAQTYIRLASKVQQQKQALGLQAKFYESIHETIGLTIVSPFPKAMDSLAELVDTLRQQATSLVDASSAQLLQSIPGVGPLVATTVLAEIGSIERFNNPKQFVAFAGLDPKVRQSGKVLNRNTKLTKRGAPELRRILFLAAHTAEQHDPELIAYYQKKRNEGRTYTAATVATTRKLCYRIYAVLKRGTPYLKQT